MGNGALAARLPDEMTEAEVKAAVGCLFDAAEFERLRRGSRVETLYAMRAVLMAVPRPR